MSKDTVKKVKVLVCFIFITCIFSGLDIKVNAAETVTIGTVGDITGDNEINAKDVTMLRRYLAKGWGVTVDEADADINADGEVNAKDVTMLRRYLAGGWGVVLPEKMDTIPEEIDIETPEESDKGIIIDKVNFPDKNFRNYVLEEIDSVEGEPGDGILDDSELSTTTIDCSALDIADLTGIEYFTALKTLCCSDNCLEKIDISHNTDLQYLDVEYNDLTELDISRNINLEQLYCSENDNLQVLDIKNNKNLTELGCDKTLKLLNLTVDISKELFPDDVFREYVREFDLNKNGYFDGDEINLVTEIDVSNKEIESLEGIKTFRELVSLNCSNTKITSLDVNGMKLEKLDAGMIPELTQLLCGYNNISELNIRGCNNLELLFCYSNQIRTIDAINTKLTYTSTMRDAGVELILFDPIQEELSLKAEREELYARIDGLIEQMGLNADSQALLKVRKVHDWIVYNITYDYIWYYRFSQGITDYGIDIRDASDDKPFDPKWVLDNRLAICSGYAHLFCLFMDRLDMECIYLGSDEMNHAWNLVLMDDGCWYHVDTTWDDPGFPELLSDKIEWNPGKLRTRDFLRNDIGISEKHYGWTCDQEDIVADGNYYEENINHAISFYCENSTIEYDEDGYLKQITYTDRSNKKHQNRYDKELIVEEKVMDAETGAFIAAKEYEYYDKDRLKREKETDYAEEETNTLYYDESGNVIKKVKEDLQGNLISSFEYECDENGERHLSKYTFADEDSIIYYNGAGELIEMIIKNQDGEEESRYTYDYYETGKKKQEICTTSEGITTTTCYNESGKVSSITTVDTSTGKGTIIEYEYHENGNIRRITKKDLAGEIYEIKEYDEDGFYIFNNGTGNQDVNENNDFDW